MGSRYLLLCQRTSEKQPNFAGAENNDELAQHLREGIE
jgi:hypothetical protein